MISKKLYEEYFGKTIDNYFNKNLKGLVGNKNIEESTENDDLPVNTQGVNIFGHNIVSAKNNETREALNYYLDKIKKTNVPSIFLLNECGEIKYKKLLKRELREEFRSLIDKSRKTAMIFNKELKLNVIFDQLNDDYNKIAALTNAEGQRIIVFNAYVQPGEEHQTRFSAFKFKLETVLKRFAEAKLIIFGDFNLNKDKMKKQLFEDFTEYKNLKLITSDDPDAVTRQQETVN